MRIYNLLIAAGAIVMLHGCTAGGDDPGVEYAPDMYISKGYEPYSQKADQRYEYNEHGIALRKPAPGSIAYDMKSKNDSDYNVSLSFKYPYPKTADGYDAAKANLKNPLPLTMENLEKGQRLYQINCTPCHGKEGLGDGLVAAKYPKGNIPSYKSDRIKQLPEGGMYHSITHGINLMGSYASVLNPRERWQVIQYIQYLRDN